ncbi:tudor and KH domain-containing protein homolog [Neodiprion virginianus]|uniref:tudor and KH domain-containing protein homolog n=1 Tax=Neodiprion virginianus TaxID=2961670 RepID=UPI001EE73A3C|nr:tudor and KH domain-containing protein homolog [Neodiprion virginianus]XP_046607197.1 tudor and KH domain-containing protein homolog [Neodiprion virginianus]
MKLLDRQLVLTFAIGLSLTGASAALLYMYYKKDDDPNDIRTTRLTTSRQNEVEIKVPRQHVPIIIGRAGAMIKDIQDKTETRINFSNDDKELPDRICKIRGKPESVHLAQIMIENIIANQPVIEVYETYIPQRACGRIIGRGGDTINHIQAVSGAKIMVESSSYKNPDSNQRIIIKGTAEHIAAALALVEEKVREENEIREKLDVSSSLRAPRGKISTRKTAVQVSDNHVYSTDSNQIPKTQDPEVLMEVYVSAVENPSQFWVQVVGPGAVALDELVTEMTEYYRDEENLELHMLKDVSVGQMVAAKFPFDERWYRAEVVTKLENDRYEVYFVDYGDHEALTIKEMMELRTDFLSLRLQAIECSLANVKPRDNEWSSEACDRFAELSWVAQWKALTAKVRGYKERVLAGGSSRREGSPIPCVDLYNKTDSRDINIGKELVNEGVAEDEGPWSSASSTLSLNRRDIHESTTMPRVSSSETPSPPPPTTRLPENGTHSPQTLHLPGNSNQTIVEIDLTTPKKQNSSIETVDLVTPLKTTDETNSWKSKKW